MRRLRYPARRDWQSLVESQGLSFHTIDGDIYWDESACYEFTSEQIDCLETATDELHDLCLQAVQHVIDSDRLTEFQIPESHHDWIRTIWNEEDWSLYGRFDFSYNGHGPPKLLEYNADTPTSLLESSVIQWHWLEELFPQYDQFNSIHESLIEAWTLLRAANPTQIHFASIADNEEDYGNCVYLQDTARQAGLKTSWLSIEQIGFNFDRNVFVGENEEGLEWCFKLYPWEWMVREAFSSQLLDSPTQWLEPPWKMLLSNKSLLVVLWELFPGCPYLLPASYQPLSGQFVEKPALSREGSNVAIVDRGRAITRTDGPYTAGPLIYQQLCPLPCYEGNYPVVGSWVVNDAPCGIGIREDQSPITHNLSRFIPHYFIP